AVLETTPCLVETCDSLGQVLVRSSDAQPDTVVLVAWQAMDGLLADEHRDHLQKLTSRLRLVVMVPRRWSRLLETTDLGDLLAGIIAKPFAADELLAVLRAAVASSGFHADAVSASS